MNIQNPISPSRTRGSRRLARGVAMLLAGGLVAACQVTGQTTANEGIGFREARFAEVEAMRAYRTCRDDALRLDEEARRTSHAGRYLASARLLDSCEANLGPEAAGLSTEEPMRAYALSVQNYLKGGDVAAARGNLARFQAAFPNQDLYLPNGASFIDTYEVLFGFSETSPYALSTANVSEPLRDEVRRAGHWTRN